MKRGATILALALGGGALYYLFTRSSSGASTTTTEGGRGGLGQLGASLAGVPFVGPFLAAGGAVAEQYEALPQQDKNNLQKYREKLNNTFIQRLGRLDPVTSTLSSAGVLKNPTKDRRAKRNELKATLWSSQAQREGAENHARRQLNAISQPNVAQWWIDQSGTTNVRYYDERGKVRPEPWKLPVPYWAESPIAWAYEATSRIFGQPIQAGRGPVEGTFDMYDTAYISDENPFGSRQNTYDGAVAFEADMRARIARKHL